MEQTKMTRRPSSFTNILLIATWLAVGCTSSGTLGCGSGDGASAPTVDSELLGIYEVDRFQSSPTCEQLMDVDVAPRVVLYSASPDEKPEEAILAGRFCGSVDDCKARASATPGVVNYSFLEGSDAQGWQGWGIASQGMVGEQCQVDVQTHLLTSSSDQTIRIDTKQAQTTYEATIDGTEATCSLRDAIDSVGEDSPCTGLFLLEATFETSL
jgi:hypothetical protein